MRRRFVHRKLFLRKHAGNKTAEELVGEPAA
jgi:hypothetical protein